MRIPPRSSADRPILDTLAATGSVTFPDLIAMLAPRLHVSGSHSLRHNGYIVASGISKYLADALAGLVVRRDVVIDLQLPPRAVDAGSSVVYYATSATIRRRSSLDAETIAELRRDFGGRPGWDGLRSSATFTIR